MNSAQLGRHGLRSVDGKIVIVIRQSSPQQPDDHKASAEVQRQQKKYLERANFDMDRVETRDLRGESGRRDAERPGFERLLDDIRDGRIGMIVLARHDRFGRNDRDASRLFDAMKDNGTLCLIGGRLYNPRDANDDLILQIQASFAAFENRARTRWMVRTRIASAEKRNLLIPLPSGLVWADPTDPGFRKRMRDAGLERWLERTDEHDVSARREDGEHFVFPYPDHDVFEACRLRIEWTLETRNLSRVLDRMRAAGGDWPDRRAGQYPAFSSWLWSRDLRPDWRSIDRPGYNPHGNLRRWLGSPSLFGVYHYTSEAASEADDEPEVIVSHEDAFPSYGNPGDRARIEEIRRNAFREPNQGSYRGPRNHVLERIRCAHEVDGDRCLNAKSVIYPDNEPHRYLSGWCQPTHGHPDAVNRCVEEVVLEVIADTFDTDRLDEGIEQLRVDRQAVLDRRKDLARRRDKLQSRIEACRDAELDAREEGRRQDLRDFQTDRERYREELNRVETKLNRVQREEEQVRRAEQEDLDRIRALASDLPALIKRARRLEKAEEEAWEARREDEGGPEDGETEEFVAEGLVRGIVAELVDTVYAKRIAPWCYRVIVEFPTGMTVRRVAIAQSTLATHAERVWACHRLRQGADPGELAERFSRVDDRRRDNRSEWTPDLVRTAALVHAHEEPAEPREGEHESVEELAERIGLDPETVFDAVLGGKLGPARYRDGTLLVRPTDEELHRTWPDVARRQVAAREGWPAEDAVRLADIKRELGRSYNWLYKRTAYGSGKARDAVDRVYVRRSDMQVGFQDFVDDALELPENAHHRDRERKHWRTPTEGAKRIDASKQSLVRHAPTLSLPDEAPTQHQEAVWVGPEVVDRFRGEPPY